jgi:aryl-alcohol dehydrogenase-like predicted oxidoreductase
VPLVGARTRERLAEALPAAAVRFTADDLARIDQAVPHGSARGDGNTSALVTSLDRG